MKTAELTGALLDYWVARAEGMKLFRETPRSTRYWLTAIKGNPTIVGLKPTPTNTSDRYSPSTNWNQGGSIIERKRIEIRPWADNQWGALTSCWGDEEPDAMGPTPLIAAMRAYVASKFGAEVPEVP